MFDAVITNYIKTRLELTELFYGRLSWIWSPASAFTLEMKRDKPNLVNGILIMNFGIHTTGTGNVISIIDKVVNEEIYRNDNTVRDHIISPFFYLVKGNELSFTTTEKCVFGFNYITIEGDTKR